LIVYDEYAFHYVRFLWVGGSLVLKVGE
jgi:hypothetical protein